MGPKPLWQRRVRYRVNLARLSFDILHVLIAAAGSFRIAAMSAGTTLFTELTGLSQKWDQVEKVRARLRAFGQLCVAEPAPGESEAEGPVAKTIQNLKYNLDAVVPLLEVMCGHVDKVPHIESLQAQIRKLFEANGKSPTQDALNMQAWTFRYLYGIMKQFLYKPTLPKDSRLMVFEPLALVAEDGKIRAALEAWGVDVKNFKPRAPCQLPGFRCVTLR